MPARRWSDKVDSVVSTSFETFFFVVYNRIKMDFKALNKFMDEI
jgi:hypothetical protein